eukprot:UN4599
MIVMGAAADGNALKGGGGAPPAAIGSIDSNGVASGGGFGAVNGALGRVIGSVPKNMVMDVFNGFAGVVFPPLPNNMFQGGNALDANAAAKAFFPFKGVVAFLQG